MRKPTMWFSNRSDTNRAVHAHKMARGWIKKVEEQYYLCIENKDDDCGYRKAICVFVLAYADCSFSQTQLKYMQLPFHIQK